MEKNGENIDNNNSINELKLKSNLKLIEPLKKRQKIELHSRTKSKILEVNFIWTIENYSYYIDNANEILKSDKFLMNSMENGLSTSWQLIVHQNDELKKSDKKDISVKLLLADTTKSSINVKVSLSIITDKGDKHNCFNSIKPIVFDKKEHLNCPNIIKKKDLNNKLCELMPNDTLTIHCNLETTVQCTSTINEMENFIYPDVEFNGNLNISSNDDDDDFTPIYLIVEKKKFSIPRAFLIIKSSYFAGFINDGGNQYISEIEIPELDINTFKKFQEYLYTDEITDLNIETAKKLFKYSKLRKFDKLTVLCEAELYKNITIQNSADLLLFADENEANQLKPKAMKYVIDNLNGVVNTNGYVNIEDSYPEIIVEMVRFSVQQKFRSIKVEAIE